MYTPRAFVETDLVALDRLWGTGFGPAGLVVIHQVLHYFDDPGRVLAQASREERLRHADDVLLNDRDLAWLDAEVERLHTFYLTLRGGQP